MGGIRRKMEYIAPVDRDYVVGLLEKVDSTEYGTTIRGSGLSSSEQKLRNKALISTLYLTNRRISELVGRIYAKHGMFDDYKGTLCRNFRLSAMGEENVLIMNCRILKKWNKKEGKARIVRADTVMFLEDEPFILHILDWLQHRVGELEFKHFIENKRISKKYLEDDVESPWNERFIRITQARSWQIFNKLDPEIVGSHWMRHMRLTHLAEYMNPYELRKVGRWESIDPAIAYVHGKFSKYADACKKARG